MSKKPYELGIIVGRFQTFHTGHEEIVAKAIELCGTVGLFIGSSQESGTFKNPFKYETREKILKKVFGGSVKVFPLPDIGVGNNGKWGEYVLQNVRERFGRNPDLLISGKEERRVSWFDGIEGVSVSELYVPKTIDISATKMREFFINDDFDEWKKYTSEKLWDEYSSLRAEVLSSKDNLFTESM